MPRKLSLEIQSTILLFRTVVRIISPKRYKVATLLKINATSPSAPFPLITLIDGDAPD